VGTSLSGQLGFSKEDRDTNIRPILRGDLLSHNGVAVLCR